MANAFVLGNGQMLVGLNQEGLVTNFFYPYVGQENHLVKGQHNIGIWFNNNFVSFDDKNWNKELSYQPETLITNIKANHRQLPFDIILNDFVHHEKNIFIRKLTITNKTDNIYDLRVFFNQIFQIYESEFSNTAYYNPILRSIIHYKGKRYFLINGCLENKCGISDFEISLSHLPEYKGSWADAHDDGLLKGTTIGLGPVDSTVSFEFNLQPKQKNSIYYWICAGKNLEEVSNLNQFINNEEPEKLLNETKVFWQKWVNKIDFDFKDLDQKIIDHFKRSLLIINTQVDKNGAFIASSDPEIPFQWKDTYNYCWPRDGTLIARSLDRANFTDLTNPFFKFCNKILSNDGYVFTKYLPDGSIGPSWHPWINDGRLQLPIQQDQTALILDSLWKHFIQIGKDVNVYKNFEPLIKKITKFLLNFIDIETGLPKESYDLWEEKLGIHTWTASSVYAALMAAAHFEKLFGEKKIYEECLQKAKQIKKGILNYLWDEKKEYFIKSIYYKEGKLVRDYTLDGSSAYSIFHWGILSANDHRIKKSFDKYLELCKTPIGGYCRFSNDIYYRASNESMCNAWFITTLWVAEYYIKIASNLDELNPAKEIFEWTLKYSLPTGLMSEQLNPYNGNPISVIPLTWSHASFIIAVNKYLEKINKLTDKSDYKSQNCQICLQGNLNGDEDEANYCS